jgi:tetratricopeptide (TPR) repeat protein
VVEPAGVPWSKDLDHTPRSHQSGSPPQIHQGTGGEHPTWYEVADAIYLTSVIGGPPRTGEPAADHRPEPAEPPRPPEKDPPQPPPKAPEQAEQPEPENVFKRPEVLRHQPQPQQLLSAVADKEARGQVQEASVERARPVLDVAGIIRALRPLHRKAFSRRADDIVLDEEATAERAVQDQLWLPVTRQATERWLDLTLVIDSSPSMALWRSKVGAFETLLRQLGTFRTIQRRLLDTSRSGIGRPTLRGGTAVAPERDPAELLDPSGRRIVLVLTDGVSRIWRSAQTSAMLARLAGSMPTALVHLLPQRLWRQSGLSLHRARLKPRGRLAPNCRWSMALPDAWLESSYAGAPVNEGAVPIPVLELEARWLGRLAHLLMGREEPVDAPVVLASTASGNRTGTENSSDVTPRDQVRGFLSTASPTAFRLATLLAAVPVSLEAARRIQTEVVPEAGIEHIAEVLSSQLFQPEPHAHVDSPWDTISFNIRPSVRKELLSSARRSETARVVRIAAPYGRAWKALDFPDSTPDPSPLTVAASEISIERIVMEALSGPYLSRAGRLGEAEENVHPSGEEATSTNTVSNGNDMSNAAERGALVTEPDPTSGHTRESLADGHSATHHDPDLAPVSTHPGSALLSWSPPAGIQRQPGESPPIWGNVPPRNPNFTGRVDLLSALGDRLKAGGPTAVLPSALHGMGGIGKTQTAVEYVYQHLNDYDLIWWIEAATATQIRGSLTELAKALGLPGAAEANTAVPAVREALRLGKPYGKWLLVFDAADGPEIVRPFFPTNGAGDILITSRNPDWASVARPLEVATFERAESIELLKRRGPDIEDDDADRLADTLGDLPLAIEQAAAWRAETGMPVEEYLRLFDEKVAEILDTSAPTDYEVSVAAAWNVSFDELRKRNAAAHQLLQICAFFSSEPIPRYFFSGVRGISIAPELDKALRDPMQLSRAIRDINRYGLAKIDHRNGTLQLHRLVQVVLRNRMAPRHQEEMRHGAHLLLANLDPNDPLSQKEWQRYQDLMPHAYASNIIECDDGWGRQLILNLMRYLFRWGDHDEAMNLAEYAVERWKAELGDEDPQTLDAASRLGYYYWIKGKYPESAELNRNVLEVRRRVDGENNEETLSAQVSVAADLRTQGDFAASAKLSAETYEKARALFGDDDPATMRFARSHCISLRLIGQYKQAAELDGDTYQRLVIVLGNDDPETLSTLSGLIMDRREAGEYLWARQEQEKLAIRAQKIHGENNADTLRRFAYLSVARRKAGDHKGALELSTDVLERFRTRYGHDNFNFNVMACALGQSIDLRHAGDLRRAKELGEEIMESYRIQMGEHHPYTKCAEVDLAVTLRLLGDPAAACSVNERSLEKLREVLGPDHVHAILCSINLASDLAAVGDEERALALTTEALGRAERVLGDDHPTTLAASLNLVLDLRALGRGADAEKRYADVLSRYRKVLGEQHPATINATKGIRADCDIDPLPL